MTEENQKPLPPPPGWADAMQGKDNSTKRKETLKRIMIVMSLTFFGMFLWLYILYNLSHSKKTAEAQTQTQTVTQSSVQSAQAPQQAMIAPPAQAASSFGVPRGAAELSAQSVQTAPYQTPGGYQPAAYSTAANPLPAQMQAQSPYATANVGPYGATVPMAGMQPGGMSQTALPQGAMPQTAMSQGAMSQGAMSQGAMPGQMPSQYAGGVPTGATNNLPPVANFGQPAYSPDYARSVIAPRGGVTMSAPREFRHAIGIAGGAVPASIPNQRQRTVVSR